MERNNQIPVFTKRKWNVKFSTTFDERKALSCREKSEPTDSAQNPMGKDTLPGAKEIMEVWMGKYHVPKKF